MSVTLSLKCPSCGGGGWYWRAGNDDAGESVCEACDGYGTVRCARHKNRDAVTNDEKGAPLCLGCADELTNHEIECARVALVHVPEEAVHG